MPTEYNEDNPNASIPDPVIPKRMGRPPKTVATEAPKETITDKTDAPKASETVIPEGKVMIDADRLARLEQQIDVLRDAVKEDRLARSEEKFMGKKEPNKVGHLKVLKGKVIVKWFGVGEEGSKASAELIYTNNQVTGEKLIGHYRTIEGEDIICDMNEFTRATDVAKFDVLSKEGNILTVRFHDKNLPSEFAINKRYINP